MSNYLSAKLGASISPQQLNTAFTLLFYKIGLDLFFFIFLRFRFLNRYLTVSLNYTVLVITAAATLFMGLLWKRSESLGIRGAQFLVMLSVIPILSIGSMRRGTMWFVITVSAAGALMLWATARYCHDSTIPPRRALISKEESRHLAILLLLLGGISVVLTAVLSTAAGGIDLRLLSFARVYEVRKERSLPTWAIYLSNPTSRVFIPAFFLLAMSCKRYVAAAVAISCTVVLYLSVAHKAIFFSLAVVALLWALRNTRDWQRRILYFVLLGSLLATLFALITSNYLPLAIFPVRALYLPAAIALIYFSFFSNHELAWYRESLPARILGIDSPYPKSIPEFIAVPPSVRMNTGVWGDGFANASFLGILIAAVVVSGVLIVADRLAASMNNHYLLHCLAVPGVLLWNDSALLTSMITGGWWALLVVIALFGLFPIPSDDRPILHDLLENKSRRRHTSRETTAADAHG